MALLQLSGSLVVNLDAAAPLPQLQAAVVSRTDQEKVLLIISSLQAATAMNVPSVFVSLAAPYETAVFAPYSDAVVASYNGNTYLDSQGQEVGVAHQALCRLLLGVIAPTGRLPINIPAVDGKSVLYPRGHGLGMDTLVN